MLQGDIDSVAVWMASIQSPGMFADAFQVFFTCNEAFVSMHSIHRHSNNFCYD